MVATSSLAALALFLVLPRLVNPLESSIDPLKSTVLAQNTRTQPEISSPLYEELRQILLQPKPRIWDDKHRRLQCSKRSLGCAEHVFSTDGGIQPRPIRRSGQQKFQKKRSNGDIRPRNRSQPPPTKQRSTRVIVSKWAALYTAVLLGSYFFILPTFGRIVEKWVKYQLREEERRTNIRETKQRTKRIQRANAIAHDLSRNNRLRFIQIGRQCKGLSGDAATKRFIELLLAEGERIAGEDAVASS